MSIAIEWWYIPIAVAIWEPLRRAMLRVGRGLVIRLALLYGLELAFGGGKKESIPSLGEFSAWLKDYGNDVAGALHLSEDQAKMMQTVAFWAEALDRFPLGNKMVELLYKGVGKVTGT